MSITTSGQAINVAVPPAGYSLPDGSVLAYSVACNTGYDPFCHYVPSVAEKAGNHLRVMQLWEATADEPMGIGWLFTVWPEQYGWEEPEEGLRLDMGDTAFPALAQMPEFFARLAEDALPPTLWEIAELLKRMGAVLVEEDDEFADALSDATSGRGGR